MKSLHEQVFPTFPNPTKRRRTRESCSFCNRNSDLISWRDDFSMKREEGSTSGFDFKPRLVIRWAVKRESGRIDILLIWRLIESGTGDTIVNDLKRISQPIDVRLLACKEREVREDSFPNC